MSVFRIFKWTVGAILMAGFLTAIYIAFFGWNWLREPIERITFDKTGRELRIGGDIKVNFYWPLPHIQASDVSFANPPWAREKQMITAETVVITFDALQLLRQQIVFPEVRLQRPVIFLEKNAGGQKNWLLDRSQKNEAARIQIGRLTLDHGMLGYDDAVRKISIRSEISSSNVPSGTQPAGVGLTFTAQGLYKGLPFKAQGSGGPVLALRDVKTPYPLTADLFVGRTVAKVEGTITSLLKFSALDMQLTLRGETLAELFPLFGIAFPETRAYTTQGHLVRAEKTWRYEGFSGRVGRSDIAGSIQVDSGGKRPAMKADLVSSLLDFSDLGPVIGARSGSVQDAMEAEPLPPQTTSVTPARARMLPEMPFKILRWGHTDAEVSLKAKKIYANKLPLEDLDTHLSMRDSVLTLDPLDFGLAGGHLNGVISLDGRTDPIQADARIKAKNILLEKLFPKVGKNKANIGKINGTFDLAGTGNSVRRMLATSSGKVGLVVTNGVISQLMMEQAGLHLWEMLELNVTGDRLIKLRCGVANFDVNEGTMHADTLVFDTEVTTIIGTGNVDLAQERLDLTLNQKTKNTSPLALRSPIHVRGSFARPDISIDKGRVALRTIGALALGLVNPFLALIPLIDAGPGSDSDCEQLVRDARAFSRSSNTKTDPRTSK